MDNLNLDGIKETIKGSFDYYEKEEDPYYHVEFFITNNDINTPWFKDEYLDEAIYIFASLGYKPEPCDTIWEDFNLNRMWICVDCPQAIRDYGYTLPLNPDKVDLLARLIELEYSGHIRIIIRTHEE